jgi:hypothetical protein
MAQFQETGMLGSAKWVQLADGKQLSWSTGQYDWIGYRMLLVRGVQ